MQVHELRSELARLLGEIEADLDEFSVRRAMREARDEIYADNRAFGRRVDDSFFNFVALRNSAVFGFFEDSFSVYVLACDEHTLIGEVRFALSETAECRRYLRERHGKHEPDLVVPRTVAEFWPEGG
jgi:hypothetical protein